MAEDCQKHGTPSKDSLFPQVIHRNTAVIHTIPPQYLEDAPPEWRWNEMQRLETLRIV